MEKKLRRNRIIERAGVNASRAFFEQNGCTFVEIDLGNDYGKDAYVDVGNGETVSAICAALQIKAGKKYKSASGYKIPVSAIDVEMWRDSTIPIMGIVLDMDDNNLRWINISNYIFLNDTTEITSIPIPKDNILTKDIIIEFSESIRKSISHNKAGPIAQLCDKNTERQCEGVYDCFALGREDYRYFIGMRYLLPNLHFEAKRLSITALGHLTPHPDIFWNNTNWITEEIKQEIIPHFTWTPDEVLTIIASISNDELERGKIGQTAVMLLTQDPNIQNILEDIVKNISDNDSDIFNIAMLILLHLSEDNSSHILNDILILKPHLNQNCFIQLLRQEINDHGFIMLF